MVVGKRVFAAFTLATLVLAVDPTPAERAKWDAVCQDKAGPQFRMTFDANGKPTGKCEAPTAWACYWGAYKDPKTGADGCCGKDKGTFSTDSRFPQEGGCCVSPNVYSFDNVAKAGGCCPSNQAWSVDAASGKGGCCSAGEVYSVEPTSGQGGCCTPPAIYKVDTLTGKGSCCAATHDFSCSCACKAPPPPGATCPSGHGTVFTSSNGKKYKLFCGLINHGSNDLGQATAPDWETCINRCAALPNCVRAIYNPSSSICYLRTHGNNLDPVTPDPYNSAHLIEDPTPPVTSPVPTIPKECPAAEGKRVVVGGIEYQLFCTKSFANTIESSGATNAADIEACMKDCSENPDCHGVNFFDDGQPGGCVHASEWEFEPTGAQLAGKQVVAIPVKQRS